MPAPHDSPTLGSDLSTFGDADLDKATIRAYREAARCWAEYRANPSGDVGRMLLSGAEAAEEWWQMLRDEQARRLTDGPVEVLSADRYEPVTSPWVRKAEANDLPARVDGVTTDRRVVR